MATRAGYDDALQAARPSPSATVLRAVRNLHLYIGVFIAPALLFFAFTGAMQTLSLHESAGTDYKPPSWLARMGQLHKDQNIVPRKPRPAKVDPASVGQKTVPGPGAAPAAPPKPLAALSAKEHEHLPEKLFFLLVSLGLFTSTLTGIFMAYRYKRGKVLITILLFAGIAVPLLLLPF